MVHATMFINRGVEVNLARRALHGYEDLQALIPDDGGYVSNIFNNQHDCNLDHCIGLIHSAIHENRERYHRHEQERSARAKGKVVCGKCSATVKLRWIKVASQWGGTHDQAVCPNCGAEIG